MEKNNLFLGTHVNLTDRQVGNFVIEGLVGRNAARAPRWKIRCKICEYSWVLDHERIAPIVQGKNTQISLLCANPACSLHRQEHHTETVEQFKRRIRKEEEQRSKEAAEVQRAAEAQAVAKRAEDAKLATLQASYRVYWNHQIKTAIEERQIVSFARWRELQPGTREMVLSRCKADPTVYFLHL